MTDPVDVAAGLNTATLGAVVGRSEALTIPQSAIAAFADVTGDHQWIHVDEERAADGPYGAPIAHGYLVLSLLPRFTRSVVDFASQGTVINYGLNRVRFLGAARSGAEFYDEITLRDRTDKSMGTLYELEHAVTEASRGDVVCSAFTLTLVHRAS